MGHRGAEPGTRADKDNGEGRGRNGQGAFASGMRDRRYLDEQEGSSTLRLQHQRVTQQGGTVSPATSAAHGRSSGPTYDDTRTIAPPRYDPYSGPADLEHRHMDSHRPAHFLALDALNRPCDISFPESIPHRTRADDRPSDADWEFGKHG